MSGKRAAQALLDLDSDLANFADSLSDVSFFEKRNVVTAYIKNHVMNTWTLTLAARSAGVSERQVITALLHLPPLRFGSTCVCQGIAAELFG